MDSETGPFKPYNKEVPEVITIENSDLSTGMLSRARNPATMIERSQYKSTQNVVYPPTPLEQPYVQCSLHHKHTIVHTRSGILIYRRG